MLYLYFFEEDTNIPVMIGADQFTVNGTPAEAFEALGPNAYSILYLNGVPQEQDSYVLTSSSLTIDPDGSTILAGTPAMVQIVSFNVEIT